MAEYRVRLVALGISLCCALAAFVLLSRRDDRASLIEEKEERGDMHQFYPVPPVQNRRSRAMGPSSNWGAGWDDHGHNGRGLVAAAGTGRAHS
eukprot:1939123-Rhodomonas_salina.2